MENQDPTAWLQDLVDSTYELAGLLQLAAGAAPDYGTLPRLIAAKRTYIDRCIDRWLVESAPEALAALEAEVIQEADEESDTPEAIAITDTAELPDADVSAGSRYPRFTLNDRYLYARELFGGSPQAMNAVVERLLRLPSGADMERVFYAEIFADRENVIGRRFLETLTACLSR